MNDTGESARSRLRGNGVEKGEPEPNRRSPDAASVSNRWWEVDVPLPSERWGPGQVPAPPSRPNPSAPAGKAPPPPPPLGSQRRGNDQAEASAAQPNGMTRSERLEIQRLEQELAAARDEAAALHEMLEDLPDIFERKFRQRLQGILEQQQLLLADNRLLREQLYALQPAAAEPESRASRLLPPASTPAPGTTLASSARPEPLSRVLHGIRRLGQRLRPGAAGSGAVADPVSPGDDGLPTAG